MPTVQDQDRDRPRCESGSKPNFQKGKDFDLLNVRVDLQNRRQQAFAGVEKRSAVVPAQNADDVNGRLSENRPRKSVEQLEQRQTNARPRIDASINPPPLKAMGKRAASLWSCVKLLGWIPPLPQFHAPSALTSASSSIEGMASSVKWVPYSSPFSIISIALSMASMLISIWFPLICAACSLAA